MKAWIVVLIALCPLMLRGQLMTTGDFNGDGVMDEVVVELCGANYDRITVLLGSGGGFVEQPAFSVPAPGREGGCGGHPLLARDFNKDGKLDLAIFHANGTVTVLLGKGDGTFDSTHPVQFNWGGDGDVFIAIADFNGDGNDDIAIASTGFAFYNEDAKVIVLLGGSGGTTFGGAIVGLDLGLFDHPVPVDTLTVSDVNGDGKLDLTVTRPDGTTVVLLGNGDGTFTVQ